MIDTSAFLKWLFIVVVTGALIGLGAPFWFDVASKLAQVTRGGSSTATAAPAPPSASEPPPSDATPSNPLLTKEIEALIDNVAAKTGAGPTAPPSAKRRLLV